MTNHGKLGEISTSLAVTAFEMQHKLTSETYNSIKELHRLNEYLCRYNVRKRYKKLILNMTGCPWLSQHCISNYTCLPVSMHILVKHSCHFRFAMKPTHGSWKKSLTWIRTFFQIRQTHSFFCYIPDTRTRINQWKKENRNIHTIQENTRNGNFDANCMLTCYSFSISQIMNPTHSLEKLQGHNQGYTHIKLNYINNIYIYIK